MKFLKKLLCPHYYILIESHGEYTAKISTWFCCKCNKTIIKHGEWVPINYQAYKPESEIEEVFKYYSSK